MLIKDCLNAGRIAEIDLLECKLLWTIKSFEEMDHFKVSRRQIIENDNPPAKRKKEFNRVAADIARSTCHEDRVQDGIETPMETSI